MCVYPLAPSVDVTPSNSRNWLHHCYSAHQMLRGFYRTSHTDNLSVLNPRDYMTNMETDLRLSLSMLRHSVNQYDCKCHYHNAGITNKLLHFISYAVPTFWMCKSKKDLKKEQWKKLPVPWLTPKFNKLNSPFNNCQTPMSPPPIASLFCCWQGAIKGPSRGQHHTNI